MKAQRSIGLMAGLAWEDLRHEWILSLCLFLAVAAVVGPLLLLFGLKNGTMETLRSRLLQDPRNREIRPMVSRSFTPQWLEDLAADPRAAFLVPATRSISASVDLKFKDLDLNLEALPSAEGDPLLLENGAGPPKEGQCVLSAEAARKLAVKAGDRLTLAVKRLKGRGFEEGQTALVLAGILDPRATARDAVYFPLSFLEDIEAFKDGQAVSRLGWTGATPLAEPVFDGVALGLDFQVDPVLKVRLTSGTGLSHLEALDREHLMDRLGYLPREKAFWYLLTTKRALGLEVVTAVSHRLRGRNALVLPWVKPLEIRLGNDNTQLMALPPEGLADRPATADLVPGGQLRQVLAPKGMAPAPETELALAAKPDLVLPVALLENHISPFALASPELAGILNLGLGRDLRWDPDADRFILMRRGYAAFRLYARTLDDVEPLKRMLEAQGIPVHTQAERIRDLKELDRHLGTIFWLIALGGLLGGAGALTASLYASVERKRRDLGVLGLMGFSQGRLLSFPLYQALFLTLGGLILALAFYLGMAAFINGIFAFQLATGERICQLGMIHLAQAAAGVVVLGQIAAALAAFRVISIDPAEALRDE